MEIFVHSDGKEEPELRTTEPSAPVGSLLESEPGAQVWLEDTEDSIDPTVTIEESGIKQRSHIHRSRCREVEVTVRFNADEFERDFKPAATIRRVYAWASGPEAAKLSPDQIAKHVLAIPGADHFLSDGVHVGSLVTPGSCAVILDLLPKERFEG